MSFGPTEIADNLTAVNHDNVPHVLWHPVLGLYLGNGIWSKDQRDEIKTQVAAIESAPTCLGNRDVSKMNLGPNGWNAIQRAAILKQIEMRVCFPDLPDERASKAAVRTYGIPAW